MVKMPHLSAFLLLLKLNLEVFVFIKTFSKTDY